MFIYVLSKITCFINSCTIFQTLIIFNAVVIEESLGHIYRKQNVAFQSIEELPLLCNANEHSINDISYKKAFTYKLKIRIHNA